MGAELSRDSHARGAEMRRPCTAPLCRSRPGRSPDRVEAALKVSAFNSEAQIKVRACGRVDSPRFDRPALEDEPTGPPPSSPLLSSPLLVPPLPSMDPSPDSRRGYRI